MKKSILYLAIAATLLSVGDSFAYSNECIGNVESSWNSEFDHYYYYSCYDANKNEISKKHIKQMIGSTQ